MTTANDIVQYARTWRGYKWKHQGRGEGSPPAIDCAGLLVVTAHKFDLPYEDLMGYGKNPERQFVKQIEEYTLQGSLNGPLHGAIGIFTDSVMPCHCGIIATDGSETTVIHAECRPRRSVHEEPFEASYPSLRSRLVDIRLFKDVQYG